MTDRPQERYRKDSEESIGQEIKQEDAPETTDSRTVTGRAGKRPGKRGRKPSKVDVKVKLERSRQSARECRARKKLRYQYLEELVSSREKAIYALREELEQIKKHSQDIDEGKTPRGIAQILKDKS